MKTDYPYSRELKRPQTSSSGIDMGALVESGKMNRIITFLAGQTARYRAKTVKLSRLSCPLSDGTLFDAKADSPAVGISGNQI